MDVLLDSNKMNKPALKDITEGIVNSNILFKIDDYNKNYKDSNSENDNVILTLAKRKFQNEGDVALIVDYLSKGKVIIKTQNLALDHLLGC